MPSFADRLAEAVRAKGPLCVGLDPRWESLPKALRERFGRGNPSRAIEAFSMRVLGLVHEFAGVVKPQAAFFELHGADGMGVLRSVLSEAKYQGFVTILDAKRGDIASPPPSRPQR